ncbi:hypothetical protein V1478_008254 [Vespula squamosa]|uniref:Uncharacterized protein n=1 Tax=Vespula squamosa TaxID=30214 RepID=A0ABD2AYA2_VESSQ
MLQVDMSMRKKLAYGELVLKSYRSDVVDNTNVFVYARFMRTGGKLRESGQWCRMTTTTMTTTTTATPTTTMMSLDADFAN